MGTQRKKVIFFTSGAVGGAERVSLTVAKMLSKSGYEVLVVHVCNNVSNLDQFIPSWMPSKHIKIRGMWDLPTIRIYNLIKKEKPYAVFSSLIYINVRVIAAAKLAGVKKIIVRNDNGWSNWKTINKLLTKLTYPKASHIILQTDEMRTELTTVLPKLADRMHTIPNPIDIDTITDRLSNTTSPYSTEYTNFVYTGRINQVKAVDTLILAFRQVADCIPNAKLFIVGDNNQHPDYYMFLRTLISQNGLDSKIEFTGFQSNPYRYMKYADCFVLPSRIEGNPNVLHEAMWLGVPVVATRSVPIVDRIVSASRGYVVDVDDVQNLAKAMIKAIDLRISIPYKYQGGNFVNLF